MFPTFKIGDLKIKTPIIQGGMGVGISMSSLASAVANEGGIGVISSVALGILKKVKRKDLRKENIISLRDEIRKTREKTDGVIGLNVMVAASDFDEIVKTGFEEKVDIIFMGAGLPIKLPNFFSKDYLKSVKTKLAPIVSSARAAKLIFKSWERRYNIVPDAIVVEGPKAGGHLGFTVDQIDNPKYSLENIIPEVVKIIEQFQQKFGKKIPVIAGGGIFSGGDIKKILDLGASAVQMGTRFVATDECDADIKFKEQYVNCKKEDIGLIKSPVGLPGRAIINNFLTDVSKGVKKPFNCPWKCLQTCNMQDSLYCIADALMKAKIGDLKNGFSFAGINAYRINKIVSVKELMDSLRAEYEFAILGKVNKQFV